MLQKISSLLAIIFFTYTPFAFANNKIESKSDKSSKWKMIFEDNFDGESLDRSIWVPSHFADSGNCRDIAVNIDSPETVAVRDGNLVLTVQHHPGQTPEFTTGRVQMAEWTGPDHNLNAKTTFSFTYGRVEFRAKMPEGAGFWPAVWMLPDPKAPGFNKHGKTWPATGEIDILEMSAGTPGRTTGALHFGDKEANDEYRVTEMWLPKEEPSFSDDFHTFALEWTDHSLTWYVDGKVMPGGHMTVETMGPGYQWIFDHPFYVIISLALGGNFGPPDENTQYPGEFLIDYIRIYQRQ